ncbi:hypothetical protein [Sinorhizobium fredii]|uniref:hypothetical protein n=1 Tax=Rhizobium fredii TaxID=380 RepID=UPI0035199060
MIQVAENISLQDAERRIFVQVVSQVGLVVRGDDIFRELQKRVLRWGFDPSRNLRNIPDGAWEGESFEIDQDNSEQAEAVRLDKPRYWAFRLRERLKDTSRIWTTEVGIAERSSTEAVFGCRLICAQRGNSEPIPRSIPNFVRGIAFTQNAYLDGRRTSPEPWVVDTEDDVEELVAFIEAPHRNHPIVALSLPEGSGNPDETVLPVHPFIRRTVGFVHTVVVTSDAAFALTDRIGKEFSVYRQAVRTYNPGFDPGTHLPTDHPVATVARILDWGGNAGAGFTDFLVEQALRITRPRDVLEREQPSFQHLKRIAAQHARETASAAGRDDSELLKLAEDEVRAAKQEAEASLELAVNADSERQQAVSELRQIKAGYMALQARLDSLLVEQPASTGIAIPESLDDIETWTRTHLSGQVELHPKAVKAVRASDFQDVALVYNALLMMRDLYVPMRRIGGIERKNAFETRLAELGLENTPCFAQENKSKNFGGAYFVRYQESTRELDWHLKGSNSRDGRLGFRLYYFWDAETARVIVGYLPGHLKTDIT